MTDWPATASVEIAIQVTMRATVLVLPEGRMRTVSPGLTDAAGDQAGKAAEIEIGGG